MYQRLLLPFFRISQVIKYHFFPFSYSKIELYTTEYCDIMCVRVLSYVCIPIIHNMYINYYITPLFHINVQRTYNVIITMSTVKTLARLYQHDDPPYDISHIIILHFAFFYNAQVHYCFLTLLALYVHVKHNIAIQ